MKTIFKDNLDKLNFSDKILNYKNTDKWFQVPDIINETAKEFFNDDLDEKFLIEWIKEMFLMKILCELNLHNEMLRKNLIMCIQFILIELGLVCRTWFVKNCS